MKEVRDNARECGRRDEEETRHWTASEMAKVDRSPSSHSRAKAEMATKASLRYTEPCRYKGGPSWAALYSIHG